MTSVPSPAIRVEGEGEGLRKGAKYEKFAKQRDNLRFVFCCVFASLRELFLTFSKCSSGPSLHSSGLGRLTTL